MLRTLLLVALVGLCFYRPEIPKAAIDHAPKDNSCLIPLILQPKFLLVRF